MLSEEKFPTSTLDDAAEHGAMLRDDDSALTFGAASGHAIAESFVPDLSGFYTYLDYLRMKLEGRWELIKGYLREMSAPRDAHQAAVGLLYATLFNLRGTHRCQVRVAPYGVRLFPDPDSGDTTVVQPDVCVICDRTKIKSAGCYGAPDLIIEVLSPSTHQHDRLTKTTLYEQAGVREYWIVDLKRERIERRVLQADGHYLLPTLYLRGTVAESTVVAGFRVSVSEFMDEANEFEDTGDGEGLS